MASKDAAGLMACIDPLPRSGMALRLWCATHAKWILRILRSARLWRADRY